MQRQHHHPSLPGTVTDWAAGNGDLDMTRPMTITPPRRTRHGADARTRRRPRPYEALVRRAASRDAHGIGLPDLYQDLNELAFRLDYYGTLTRPKRQPCTRFVVRKAARLGLARRIARRAGTYAYREIWHPTADGGDLCRMTWVDGRIVCDLKLKRRAHA